MQPKEICRTLAVLAAIALAPFAASAAVINVPAGGNINAAVESAAAGDTIQLANGSYVPFATGGFPAGSATFAINQRVTILGNPANPALVVLNVPAANTGSGVQFLSYADGTPVTATYPHGATIDGVTINAPGGSGILIDDYASGSPQRITDITIRNSVITAKNDAVTGGNGVRPGPQRLTLDNVTVTSTAGSVSPISLHDTIDSLVMNSRVTGTVTAGTTGMMVDGGQHNTFVNNTFGNPPATNGTTIGGNGGTGTGVTLLNTQANRFELNTVQGFATDGIAVFNSTIGVTTLPAYDNYIGKNTVISNGYAAQTAGVAGRSNGTGIWMHCGASNTWVYGNDVSGGPEAGLTVWASKSVMLLGNATHGNEDGGVYIAGGTDVNAECAAVAFRQKTTSTFVQSNNIYFNSIDNIIVRNSDSTDIVTNYVSPHNGFGGAMAPCPTTTQCQSAFSIEGPELSVSNNRILGNTSLDNNRGLWVNYTNIVNEEFAQNRIIGSVNNRLLQGSTFATLDRGANIGGNYWSQWVVSGNPSTGSSPYTGISYTTGNNSGGPVSDRYPFQSETFGIATMTIAEPTAGMTYAPGTGRTVRWSAPGCTVVDIVEDATTLQSNVANTGYAVVNLLATSGSHTITVRCKSSSGALTGQSATTGAFTVAAANQAVLLAPGRDDVWNPGATVPIAWKRASGYVGSVSAEYSTDNGATWTQIAAANAGNFAYVTVPSIAATAYARVRIKDALSATAIDSTDGVFAIRGTAPGFKNVATSRSFLMGRTERLEWASPANSRRVTIVKNPGASTIVADLPDRGFYDWIVPDLGTSAGVSFSITFKDSNGTQIGSPVVSNTVATNYPSATGPFTLSVTASGSGSVSSSPAGIACPPTCSAIFPLNQAVTLTATAQTGSSFFGWTGTCTGGTTCNVTMNADRGAVASFYTGTLATRYRLYSGTTFEHLYTTDTNEYNVLPVCCAWQPEGAIYQIFRTAGSFAGVTVTPLYRLYNPTSHQHHWTVDANEYAFLATVGWSQEGTDGYVLPNPAPGALPLYRLYLNAQGGLHLWTTDANERNVLTGTGGWVDEGIANYVLPLVP